ncbi:hypothetical protein DOTSEDRAFT_68033 [Dothistroma septosporum NZE10]|uniref:FAD/NAD(P)-binding domain-containing protein n=1 Tax=Dothistroma septosporum (strain NZE10 / CBS 128990) TaxID=675120 RepID=N1Q1M7_DOTSN|nr:hypothetical protein DOTSEDRAFT_68033 [Dothistroma septosporum NZE10]
MVSEHYDAVIVGCGFAGIFQLKRLRDDLGLRCLCIDQAGGVGGTWWHNQYPGAMSDTESYVYRFSWDKDDLQQHPWKEHYVKQPEVLAYLQHVAKKHDLYKDMRFNTEMSGASWDDEQRCWRITVKGDQQLTARYLITGLGLLSKTNYPDIPGIHSFGGDIHHTAKWPKDFPLEGKRVGVIGCGSTGVQVITEIGRKVGRLICFQRHPQYSVPSGDKKVTPEYRQWVNENYDGIWSNVRNSMTAFGFKESKTSYHDVDEEERERIFEEVWQQGNGFRFMFGAFNDIVVDETANKGAQDFIRKKIGEIVKDPEKARKLKPYDMYARRPLCDGNASNNQKYFEQFNRPNVDIVDLKETPITQIEGKGIRTSDGVLHELDVLILATGFDAVEGNYSRMAIRGRNDVSLQEAWKDGPHSLLGVHVPEFPNAFMITGPKGPFTNIPPTIEAQVEWITSLIREGQKKTSPVIEATHEGEQRWAKLCEKLAANSLFWKASENWIFGANVAGKPRTLRFYFGGLVGYYGELQKQVQEGFPDFRAFDGGSQDGADTVRL